MTAIISWIITFVAVLAAVGIMPGIRPLGGRYAGPALTAVFLALINVSIKPLLQALSLPVSIVTLGIFAIVINALMLELASWLSNHVFKSGIVIDSFGQAFLGSIIISVVSALLGVILL
ncbi:MAG: phage holin family protein [Coriobacteriales bacterium]|jgi:putative membrane protein